LGDVENFTEKFAKEFTKVREAFIMEELKPYYEIKDGEIVFIQKVRVRMAEVKDFEDRTKRIIDSMIMHWRNVEFSQIGQYYIDALQSVRKNIFGEVLP